MTDPDWFFTGLERGAYGLVMIDPPWTFKTYSKKGEEKSPQAHYNCMSLQDIHNMPVRELASKDGCWFVTWATAPMYDLARSSLDAWGVSYSTQGVWVKTTKDNKGLAFGTGHVLRNCHEIYLIGKIGKPKVCSKSIRSVIMAPRREHSRKPDEAYEISKKLAGDVRYADVFSRQPRDGWDRYGDQSEFFPAAPEVSAAA